MPYPLPAAQATATSSAPSQGSAQFPFRSYSLSARSLGMKAVFQSIIYPSPPRTMPGCCTQPVPPPSSHAHACSIVSQAPCEQIRATVVLQHHRRVNLQEAAVTTHGVFVPTRASAKDPSPQMPAASKEHLVRSLPGTDGDGSAVFPWKQPGSLPGCWCSQGILVASHILYPGL